MGIGSRCEWMEAKSLSMRRQKTMWHMFSLPPHHGREHEALSQNFQGQWYGFVQAENAEEAVMLHEESRLLVPDGTSHEMMDHLRSSLSDDNVVDEVSDDLPVVFRFNQAFDVLEETRAFLVIEASNQGVGVQPAYVRGGRVTHGDFGMVTFDRAELGLLIQLRVHANKLTHIQVS